MKATDLIDNDSLRSDVPDFQAGDELKVHVKGAIRNGATKVEIREVLLQVAIYCGIPAGVDAFRVARETFVELDKAEKK